MDNTSVLHSVSIYVCIVRGDFADDEAVISKYYFYLKLTEVSMEENVTSMCQTLICQLEKTDMLAIPSRYMSIRYVFGTIKIQHRAP